MRSFCEEVQEGSKAEVLHYEKIENIKNSLAYKSVAKSFQTIMSFGNLRRSIRHKIHSVEQLIGTNKIKRVYHKMVSKRTHHLDVAKKVMVLKYKLHLNLLLKRFSTYQGLLKEGQVIKKQLSSHHDRFIKRMTLKSFKLYENVAQTES